MRKVTIAVEFDLDKLAGYSDEFLAQLWHLCQVNPAEFGDKQACWAAEAVQSEIVRRWLKQAPVALYRHQGSHVAHREVLGRRLAQNRREMAEDLVDGALALDVREQTDMHWTLVTGLLGRVLAVERVYETLGDVGLAVLVTRAGEGYLVWTARREVAA
jgi:hypothetical protein